MRFIMIAATVAVFAAPALAQEPTTLQYVTTKSVIMKVAGMEIPVTYTPDGKLSAMDGQVTGTWKIVGETLCSTNNMEPAEACILYPSGKKPGDEFPIMSPQGEVTIQINK
jgi:hypothetical protein